MSKNILMIRSSALTSLLSRQISNTFAAISQNQKLREQWYQLPVQKRTYAKVCKDCCKNVPQTEGRRVEDPKIEHTVPLRPGCPAAGSTMPHNYDPYRIKVPEIVVPPLPPSSAKDDEKSEDSWQLFRSPEISTKVKDMFRNSALAHLDYWKQNNEGKENEKGGAGVGAHESMGGSGPPPRLSYHGHDKYKFAFHEPWRPLDRLALMADAQKQHEDCDREAVNNKQSGSDFVAPQISDKRSESI